MPPSATNSRPRENASEASEPALRWKLESPGSGTRFLTLGAAAVALYVAFVATDYTSKVLAGSLRAERVALAARINPLNAAYHHILGRIAFYERQDLDSSLREYQAATRLNPHSARYWLDLANTQQIAARAEESRQSLARALAADPTNPQVANEAANFYLVLGDIPTALKLLGVAVRYSPEDARAALDLSWRATQDAGAVMEQVLPRTPEAYLMFLQLLMSRHATEAADQTWRGLMALKQSILPEAAFPYIQYLLDEGEVARARSAWEQLLRRDDRLRGYLTPGNLVTNAGFEEEILNGGFSWRYESSPHVALAVDQRESYRGRRSLSVSFDGEPVTDAGIWQYIAVEPDTTYRVSAWIRSDGIEGVGGPQLGVFDRYSGHSLFVSEPATGSTNWRNLVGEFHTDPGSKLVMLRIVRVPGNTRMRGRIWLDEVSVVAE